MLHIFKIVSFHHQGHLLLEGRRAFLDSMVPVCLYGIYETIIKHKMGPIS